MYDLSIDQLRTFVTIAECGSYTRAAEALHRTQPALSLQIKRLEEHLGTQVLIRSGRRSTVTEAGAMLLHYAQRILALNEEALAKLTAVETEGTIQIGILEEVALGPLVDLLTKFGRLCSRIRLELVVSTSSELAKDIAANKLCLAVANSVYAQGEVKALWEEPYAWVMSRDVDVLSAPSLPLVLDPLTCPCYIRDVAIEKLDNSQRSWHIAFSSLSLKAMQAAVRAGLGVGLLPQSAITPDMRLLSSSDGLPEPMNASIALYRATEATSDAANLLHDFLLEHLQYRPTPIRPTLRMAV